VSRVADKPESASWRTKLLAVFGPILLLASVIGYTYYSNSAKEANERAAKTTEKATQSQAELHQERMKWPLDSPPQRTFTHVELPPVAALPPVIDESSLDQRLGLLLKTHPVDEIRLKFEPLLASGAINLTYETSPNALAQMGVVRKTDIASTNRELSKDSDVFVAFGINPLGLTRLTTENDIRLMQIGILHEFEHYKQYKASSGKDRIIWELGLNAELPPDITQREGCSKMWRDESEAYAVGCRAANTWDIKLPNDICAYVDTPQWNQVMFHIFYDHAGGQTPCARTIAELAGHPYPEEFPEFVEP
jgi:hypothetical protein